MQARDNRVITSDKALLSKLKEGVDAIANVTKRTMGPAGSNVLIEPKYGAPWVTKDGVSVAKEVFLEDSEANMAAQLVKEAAVASGDKSGDGTTTAAVLAQALFHEAVEELGRETVRPLELKKQMLAAADKVVAEIKKRSRPVAGEELKRVAAIAANDDAMGALVYEVLGNDPTRVVALEESSALTTEIESVDGLRIDKGFVSPYMMTDIAKGEAVLTDAAVLVIDGKLSAAEDLIPSMQILAKNGCKTLLVFADDFDTNVLQLMVVNTLKGSFTCLGVKVPGFGEVKLNNTHDIAAVTGATVFGGPAGSKLEEASFVDFGRVRSVTSTKEHTTLVGGAGDHTKLEKLVENVKNQLAEAQSHFDKEKLNNRLSRLVGGVSLIKVGGATESEIKEAKQRFEDSLQAVVAAHEEGIIPGGGNALAVIAEDMGMEGDPGHKVVMRSLRAPMATILGNAGKSVSGTPLWDKGYDVRTMELKESLLDAGIIDPAKVTRVALQNAASVASTLITTTASISFLEKAKSSRDV